MLNTNPAKGAHALAASFGRHWTPMERMAVSSGENCASWGASAQQKRLRHYVRAYRLLHNSHKLLERDVSEDPVIIL